MEEYGVRMEMLKEEEDLLLNRPSVPGEYGHPLPRELMYREMGLNHLRHSVGRKILSDTLATTADYNLITRKAIKKTRFMLPAGARTTFHMAFSTDGTLVASCHGDHNVYVCCVATGKVVRTLTGHPRTPWCVVFHPTQNDILASGCLAGHVRVWDLKGGSELLVTDSGTVIASLAFHPSVRLLAIGTFNEVIFWDWNRSLPLARCSTENTKEKVRLVRFDRLGKSLITGITNFPSAPQIPTPSRTTAAGSLFRPNILRNNRQRVVEPAVVVAEGPEEPMFEEEEDEEDGQQDRFQESYRQLVTHYEDLVSHYHSFLRSRVGEVNINLQNQGQNQNQNQNDQQPGPSRLMTGRTNQTGSDQRQFSSIEALAQNILEMQNLCSEARQRVRLAPLTVETQHVVELQHIRQHLEVLQDQTRRLQSSIRATLTSLATGSLAALNPVLRDDNNLITQQNTENQGLLALQENVVIPSIAQPPVSTTPPRRSISPSMSHPNTFFRISINSQTEAPINNQPTTTSRMRVPPIIRFNDTETESQPRRIFHVIPQRTWTEEHSRNCPFNNLHPPPRMRCLTELGELPLLTVWPTFETGLVRATRLFPQEINVVNNNVLVVNQANIPELPLTPTLNAFHNWLSSSVNLPNDLGVRVFLTVRQQQILAGGLSDGQDNENWQRSFLSGLALVPTSVREGRRTTPPLSSNSSSISRRTRRAQWVCQLGRNPETTRSQIPSRLSNNFTRSFYIRSQDELIPVYSTDTNQATPPNTPPNTSDIRDSSNVYMFPVGLLLQGNYETQTIGIYHPPMTHNEDEALTEFRRNEGIVNITNQGTRVNYDNNSMQIHFSNVNILTFVQPGLAILDSVTNYGNRQRPRPTEGTVHVQYLTLFLDGIERFFGQRYRPQQILNLSRRVVNPRRIITFAGDAPEYQRGQNNLPRDYFSESNQSRRVISLAVDAAASELIRRNDESVESRIERVLNERGNRGVSEGEESSGGGRLEDIQRRISMLAQWSRARETNTNSGDRGGFSAGPTRRRPFVPSSEHNTGPMDHWVIRRQRRLTSQNNQPSPPSISPLPPPRGYGHNPEGTSARTRANRIIDLPSSSSSSSRVTFPAPPVAHQYSPSGGANIPGEEGDPAARFYPGYIPEILITPRARPPTYYTMDAATTAFLSSRIQKWDFSQFIIPDITKRESGVVVRECSLHSDACLDISNDSEFLAVLQPSDSGSYSALGVYSIRDESLGDMLYIFHFDQNTVSVSISPSCDYIVVGYAGRGPLYRFVQPTKNIGQVLSLTRGTEEKTRLVPVRELYTDSQQSALMAINCMHFLPVPGMGIVYGTNTGELVLLH